MDIASGKLYDDLVVRGMVDSRGRKPPAELLWTFAVLAIEADDIRRLLADARFDDRSTEWRLLALTDERIAYVTVAAPVANWVVDSDPPSENQVRVSGWVRGRSDVERVSIADPTWEPSLAHGDRTTLTTGWSLWIRGESSPVTLPLFGGRPNANQRKETEAVAHEILRAL